MWQRTVLVTYFHHNTFNIWSEIESFFILNLLLDAVQGICYYRITFIIYHIMDNNMFLD